MTTSEPNPEYDTEVAPDDQTPHLTVAIRGTRDGSGFGFEYTDTTIEELTDEAPALRWGALLDHLRDAADLRRLSHHEQVALVILPPDWSAVHDVVTRHQTALTFGLTWDSRCEPDDGTALVPLPEARYALRHGNGDAERPVPLGRCSTHGLALAPEGGDPRASCPACALDGDVDVNLERRPDGSPGELEFRNPIQVGTFASAVPLVEAYLEDVVQDPDDREVWVTHFAWEGDLPAGYNEPERFIPIIGYRTRATVRYITKESDAAETIGNLREQGYGSYGEDDG